MPVAGWMTTRVELSGFKGKDRKEERDSIGLKLSFDVFPVRFLAGNGSDLITSARESHLPWYSLVKTFILTPSLRFVCSRRMGVVREGLSSGDHLLHCVLEGPGEFRISSLIT